MMNLRITDAVKHLIIINILFFIGSYIINRDIAVNLLAMHFPENPDFKFWQPLTHMFMHGNFMHLLFNMIALFSFGTLLEERWGSTKFIFFYISCGLGAALLSYLIDYTLFHNAVSDLVHARVNEKSIYDILYQGKYNTLWQELLAPIKFEHLTQTYFGSSLGASGAIYGVFVAFAFLFPNVELALFLIPIPIKAKYFVTGFLLIDLFLGFKGQAILGTGDGIGHFAHLGGALTGFIMMWYWNKNQFKNNRLN